MTDEKMRTLVGGVYRALDTGDRDALLELLHPDFDGYYSPGLPSPIGGHHRGAIESIDRGWWAIGATWRLRAEPERHLPCGPDQLLVTGTYRGAARRTRRPVEAPFAHLWAAEGDRLRTLHQYTDTALWLEALREPAAREDTR